MWNFTRKRQSAGNICLILFTAFLFTILVAPFSMVGGAEAATFVENGAAATSKNITTNSDGAYSLLINLALCPATAAEFNDLQVKFDFGGGKIISVYAKDIASGSVYDTTYGNVYHLVYTPGPEFKYPNYTKVYGKLYVGGQFLQDMVLTINLQPPVLETQTSGELKPTIGTGAGSAAIPQEVAFTSSGGSLNVAELVSTVAANKVVVGGTEKNLTNYSVNGQAVNITTVTAIGGQNFSVGKAVEMESTAVGQPIVITSTAAASGTSVSIPDGTTILAPAGWDGKITPPTIVASNAVTGTAPSGFSINTDKVVKFGSEVPLLFDKPVTIVLPDTAPPVGYRAPGSNNWVQITTDAGDYDAPTLPAFPNEAYAYDRATNRTKIITWHATEFASLATVQTSPAGPGGGGSSTGVAVTPQVLSYSFGDITNHWAKDDIQLLVDKGIVAGVSANNFAPDATITRAQFATLLVKALGIAEVKPAKATFKDVKSGAWYYGTIEAAAAKGLIAGSNGSFNPNGKITRQEMAVMIAKALKVGGKNVTATAAELNKFSDKGQIASWAQSSVAVAVKEGIITGRTANTVVAKANATRAEGVVMIKKVLGSLGKL